MLRPPAHLTPKDGGILRTVLDARTYMLPLFDTRNQL
jgi:hypothetical protein